MGTHTLLVVDIASENGRKDYLLKLAERAFSTTRRFPYLIPFCQPISCAASTCGYKKVDNRSIINFYRQKGDLCPKLLCVPTTPLPAATGDRKI
ncbi:hypothetical protein [Phormidium sp. CCY1219]|uniref:hypothetical protein n=1 Tax=Phormidium sp. CCY1219 TaxID=2886104 RepID=UPI002D1F1A72|nr:hypothetical protein [Phormidium sp. CCY1219]MEB3829446.1 hypothetical protein [Phormidium sp. CCY1219]